MKRLISVALLLSLLLICFAGCEDASKRLDYLNDDLARYIDIDDEDYKGYDIKIDIPDVSDEDVENEVLKDLAAHKGALRFEGSYIRSEKINAGDTVYIKYRGYTVDELGRQIEIEGSSNLAEAYETELTIGSGQFVTGFELGLIGKVPNQYTTFEKKTAGRPTDTDVVYIKATYVVDNESVIHQDEIIRIDLNDPTLEDKWGVGIRDYVKELSVGLTDSDPITFTILKTGQRITFASTRIEYISKNESNPITLTATFPHDYSDPSLRGKRVNFDVYIAYAVHYETQALNDAFVTEKMKYTPERLAEYEGATMVEKYRAYKRAQLVSNRETEIRYAAEEEMWTRLKKECELKKYPERELQRVFNDYYYTYQMDFAQNYANYYESVDEYIRAYYGLEEGGDWEAKLREQVEGEILEKLIFYSILRKENLVPSEEHYKEIYDRELRRDFEYYGKTPYDFATEEEYLKALKDYETQIIEYYGADFYKESVYYNYASEKMLGFANVINKSA